MISEPSILLIYIIISDELFQLHLVWIKMIKKLKKPDKNFIDMNIFCAFYMYIIQILTEKLFWLPEILTFLEPWGAVPSPSPIDGCLTLTLPQHQIRVE